MDTLIAETNAGSVRWLNGLAEMPVSSQKIKDGELSEYLLPLRGYSVDELMQMKEEKRLQQEKREREELERMQKEEQEQRVRQAAEAMIPAQLDIISSATSTDFDVPYFIIYNNTGDRAKVPSVLKVASFPTAESVCAVLVSQNSNATSLRESLIPAGTAPASAYVEKIEVAAEVAKAEPEKLAEIQEEPKRTLFGGEEIGDIAYDYDGDEDDAFKVLQDWGADTVYVHKFDSFDPYLDLPSYDEIGPDGKEVRLSQLLADEEWEEEIEAAKEKATIRTYEEYIKRVGELKSAEEIEMLETQEILQAPAYARGAGEWLVKDLPDFGKYDQTKLDGISQLFGLPPNELSGIPGYVEPSVPPTGFDSISQLWDSSNIWADESTKVSPPEGDDGVFHGMSELWGVDLDNEAVDMASSANRLVVASGDGTDSSLRLTKPSIDVSRSRLSQILADEDWATEEEPPPSIEHPFTFADYEKQVQDILEAEKKELLETQAILNARPGADGIEVLEKERKVVLKVMNSTDAEDDLAVLERDAREDPSIIAQILEEEDEELLETQAILNARPGADEIEVPEKDTLSVSKLLKSTDPEDSLAVLEMDAPGYLKKFKSNANANASVPDLSTEMVESASVEEGDDTACHSVHEKGENATHAPSSSAQKGNEP